jgi:hypothetical protein
MVYLPPQGALLSTPTPPTHAPRTFLLGTALHRDHHVGRFGAVDFLVVLLLDLFFSELLRRVGELAHHLLQRLDVLLLLSHVHLCLVQLIAQPKELVEQFLPLRGQRTKPFLHLVVALHVLVAVDHPTSKRQYLRRRSETTFSLVVRLRSFSSSFK